MFLGPDAVLVGWVRVLPCFDADCSIYGQQLCSLQTVHAEHQRNECHLRLTPGQIPASSQAQQHTLAHVFLQQWPR